MQIPPIEQMKLERESEWMRVYSFPGGHYRRSKFLTDNLQVSAESIKRRWRWWWTWKRVEFAEAFVLKRDFSAEDQEIIGFLMEKGSEGVWLTIATSMRRYGDREQALAFLLKRATVGHRGSANYFQALEFLCDPRAVSVLQKCYKKYAGKLSRLEDKGLGGKLMDYLQCCRALWVLDGSPEYENGLRKQTSHPDRLIRQTAQDLLSEPQTK
ncbi:MAG: hypothetical protein HY651_07825 [Acidobacteria bacterium]|nr:hypothetical protein [Acidobacteriota bacterium]